MERFDTRVIILAASVLVAGCGGGNNQAAGQQTTVPPPPAAPQAPAAPASPSGSGTDPGVVLKTSADAAARDGYEAGLDYGQAKAEAEDKGEDPPERPENPFLEDGESLSDSDVDKACKKVDDEVEPVLEDPKPADATEGTTPEAKNYDAAAAGDDAASVDPSDETSPEADPDAATDATPEPESETEASDEKDKLDDETRLRLAAIWECAFQQGTEAGEVIYQDGVVGDGDQTDGGVVLEDDPDGNGEGDPEDPPEDDDEGDPAPADCGEGSEYAPLTKLEVERKENSIEVRVEGSTPTGGYTNPKLMETAEGLDEAGVLHLVFCITPPPEGAVTTQAFAKHTSTMTWARDPAKVTRVIVEGKNKSESADVAAPAAEPEE